MAKIRYKDDKMTYLTSDTEKLRARPLMFIGVLGNAGANHCVKEAINNAIDEVSKSSSVTPGNTVWVEFNEKEDSVSVLDNGRGINPSEVVNIYTSLNSGSNMTRANGYTLGENGVGTLCLTALARETEIRNYRSLNEKTCTTYRFKEGQFMGEETTEDTTNHGLQVIYKPSRKVFGHDAHIDVDAMVEWIRSFRYRMSPKITIHVKAIRSNGDILEDTIKAVPFKKILEDNNEKLLFSPIELHIDGDMDEEFGGTIQNRTFDLNVAFSYVDAESVPYQSSFCNGAYTTDHGSHLEGVINGIVKYLREATIATLSDKEKETISITPSDIQTGLTVSVNLMTDMMRLFVSQIKTKVDNPDLSKVLTKLVYSTLSRSMTKETTKTYIDLIKTNAKARIEATMIRQKITKEHIGKWNKYSIPNLLSCASNDKTKTELYICEGLSAKGSLRIARDPNIQAIYSIRGFPLNPYGKSISQILSNAEYKDLVTILGCGIGDSFNINKINYSKIIIASDAD